MKYIILLFAVFSLLIAPACAYERSVNLEEYVTKAEAIAVCVVEKDNGDGSVTASVTETLKGNLDNTEVIRGETGFCVMHGPVSRFMKPNNKYLVFLFQDNTVGRLGGVLEIEDDKTLLVMYYIEGFTGTTHDKETNRRTLPVEEAKQQIKVLLQKSNK
jgi:hypothetical protein